MSKDKNFPGINTIIFDLGNVIIDLDIPATDKAFKKILGNSYEGAMTQLNEKNIFHQYEKGEISTAIFIQEVTNASTIKNEQAIKDAWNAMLLDIPERRFETLKKAKGKYRTFCLSNTNELHIEFIYAQLQESKKIPNLNDYFERVYLSHEMGMRKPDKEIFMKVLSENSLQAENTLFIDDTAEHILGAKRVGINTIHLTEEKNIEMLF